MWNLQWCSLRGNTACSAGLNILRKVNVCIYLFILGGRIQLVSVGLGLDEICQRPWNQQSHTVSFDSQSDLESAATRTARRSHAELDMHAPCDRRSTCESLKKIWLTKSGNVDQQLCVLHIHVKPAMPVQRILSNRQKFQKQTNRWKCASFIEGSAESLVLIPTRVSWQDQTQFKSWTAGCLNALHHEREDNALRGCRNTNNLKCLSRKVPVNRPD